MKLPVFPKVMQDGDMGVGAWPCGMVAGLIDDIPSCKELIDRIMIEVDQLINHRLKKFG
jgi:nitronate monooxygenase